MKNLINKMFRDPISAGATLGIGLGKAVGDNVMDLAFARPRQKIQLEGQKKALEQQNAAQLDMWNKTNYEAQMKHLNAAGLNPGLLYGMSGGGATTTGSASAMPDQTTKSYGIDIMGAAQLALIKAQARDLNASASEKESRVPVNNATVPNVQANTANTQADTVNKQLQGEMQKIQNNIADVSQWYHIGKVEAEWQKAVQEYRSAAAKANVDTVTQETQIKQQAANLAMTYLQQRAVKAGINLTNQQIEASRADVMALLQNADTNMWNAETNAKNSNLGRDRLEFDKKIHDVADSMKLSVETVQDIIQALVIKGVINPQKDRIPVEGFKQKY